MKKRTFLGLFVVLSGSLVYADLSWEDGASSERSSFSITAFGNRLGQMMTKREEPKPDSSSESGDQIKEGQSRSSVSGNAFVEDASATDTPAKGKNNFSSRCTHLKNAASSAVSNASSYAVSLVKKNGWAVTERIGGFLASGLFTDKLTSAGCDAAQFAISKCLGSPLATQTFRVMYYNNVYLIARDTAIKMPNLTYQTVAGLTYAYHNPALALKSFVVSAKTGVLTARDKAVAIGLRVPEAARQAAGQLTKTYHNPAGALKSLFASAEIGVQTLATQTGGYLLTQSFGNLTRNTAYAVTLLMTGNPYLAMGADIVAISAAHYTGLANRSAVVAGSKAPDIALKIARTSIGMAQSAYSWFFMEEKTQEAHEKIDQNLSKS